MLNGEDYKQVIEAEPSDVASRTQLKVCSDALEKQQEEQKAEMMGMNPAVLCCVVCVCVCVRVVCVWVCVVCLCCMCVCCVCVCNHSIQ